MSDFFDLTNVAGQDEAVTPGTYMAECIQSELKDTKANDGKYLQTRWKIIGSSFDGRSLFARFNTQNKNEKAQQIGLQQLKSAAKACGLGDKFSPQDFMGKTCQIKTKYGKNQHGEQVAEIAGFHSLDNKSEATDTGGMF